MRPLPVLHCVLLLAVLLALTGCPQIVIFPDKALDSAIRAEIGKPFGFLTDQDLLAVRQLDARGLGIRNIQGIELCKNLAWIDLDTNQISSIKSLEQLGRPENPFDSPLVYLNLDSNEITDISALAGLLNLETVSLFNNQVADIAPLVTNVQAGGALKSAILDARTLDAKAVNVDIPILESYGVAVTAATAAGTGGGQ